MGDCDKRTDTLCSTNIYIVTSEFPRVLVTPLCMVNSNNFVNPAPRTCIRAFACHNGHAHLIRMSAHNKIHIEYAAREYA